MASLRALPYLVKNVTNSGANKTVVLQNVRSKSTLWAEGTPISKGFTWAGMKQKSEVLPLVFIIGGTCIGLGSFIIYSSQTRESVVFKNTTPTLAQSMDLNNPKPLKIFVFNQEYKPMPELAALYKEMDEFEKKDEKAVQEE